MFFDKVLECVRQPLKVGTSDGTGRLSRAATVAGFAVWLVFVWEALAK